MIRDLLLRLEFLDRSAVHRKAVRLGLYRAERRLPGLLRVNVRHRMVAELRRAILANKHIQDRRQLCRFHPQRLQLRQRGGGESARLV